jgi:hypothetical protein
MADDLDAALAAVQGQQPETEGDPLDQALAAVRGGAAAAPPKKAGAIDNILSNVYARIADTAGFPIEVANEVVNHAGRIFAGKEPGFQGGSAQRAIREALTKAGAISPGMDEKSVSGRIGALIPDSLLALVGIRAAAPRLIANAPATMNEPRAAIRQVGADIATFTTEKPATSIAGAVYAAPGQVMGHDAGGYVGGGAGDLAERAIDQVPRMFGQPAAENTGMGRRLGTKAGEAFGEIMGGVGTATAGLEATRTLGVPGTRGFNRWASNDPEAGRVGLPGSRALVRERPVDVQEPIIPPTANPAYSRQFASEQLNAEVEAVDQTILRMIHSVPGYGNVTATNAPNAIKSDAFRSALDVVEAKTAKMENQFWGRSDKDLRVHTDVLENWANDILRHPNLEIAPSNFPTDMAKRVLEIAKRNAGSVKIGELVGADSVRSEALAAAKEAGGSAVKQPNRALQARLYQLGQLVADEVAAQHPNNVPLQQANAASRAYNDRFTRGPLADILSHDYDNMPRVLPQETVPKLLDYIRGVRQVYEAANPLPNAPRKPTLAAETVVGGEEEAQMVNTLDEAVRSMYVNAAKEAGAKAALNGSPEAPASAIGGAKWLMENEHKIERMTKLTRQLQTVAEETSSLARERTYITKGALAQYTARDPEASANAIVNSIEPKRDIIKLMETFGGNTSNPDMRAIEGLQRAIVENIFGSSKSFKDIQAVVREPGLASGLTELFGLNPGDLARLNKMIDTATILETGKPGASVDRILKGGYNLFAKIVGLHIGRALAHGTASGSAGALALPAYWARTMQAQVAQLYEKEATKTLLMQAVFDPAIEHNLVRRLPGNASEAEQAFTQGRALQQRMIGALDKLHRETIDGVNRGTAWWRAGREPKRQEPPQDPTMVQP